MIWRGLERLVTGAAGSGALPRGPHEAPAPTIPVGRAFLCLDCEQIFEASGDQTCPACGSSVSWGVRKALEREESRDAAPEPGTGEALERARRRDELELTVLEGGCATDVSEEASEEVASRDLDRTAVV